MKEKSVRIKDIYQLMIGNIGRFLLKNKRKLQNVNEIDDHFHKQMSGKIHKKFPEYAKKFRDFDLRKEISNWQNE